MNIQNEEIEARRSTLKFLKETIESDTISLIDKLKACEITLHNTHSLPKLHQPRNFRTNKEE